MRSIKIYAEGELSGFLEARIESINQEILGEPQNQLLNVNETEYVEYLVGKYSLSPIRVYKDQMQLSDREELVPAERFPHDFNVFRGKSYPKQVLTYHLPFTGDESLLKLRPSNRIMWTIPVVVGHNDITFDIINWRDDAAQIKKESEGTLSSIEKQTENSSREVEGFNKSLREHVERLFRTRKEKLLKSSNLMASLGVPIRAKSGSPTTFSVPSVNRKPLLQKPQSSSAPYAPELSGNT